MVPVLLPGSCLYDFYYRNSEISFAVYAEHYFWGSVACTQGVESTSYKGEMQVKSVFDTSGQLIQISFWVKHILCMSFKLYVLSKHKIFALDVKKKETKKETKKRKKKAVTDKPLKILLYYYLYFWQDDVLMKLGDKCQAHDLN